MFYPGLVSVSFRQLNPDQIIALCVDNGLEGIEWGGDVHVPPGDLETAKAVGQKTRSAGLKIPTYGSYYRMGSGDEPGEGFREVLATASTLGAAAVRVWPGTCSWSAADAEIRNKVQADLESCREMATELNISIVLEYHTKTFTDDPEGAAFLLGDTPRPGLGTLWQPPNGMPYDEALLTLEMILPFLHHLHVFHWWPDSTHRHPLSAGAARWRQILEKVKAYNPEAKRWCLLEFVRGNEPQQLVDDARTLRELIAGI
jgi:3-dehydroshikimate dehydratase